MLKETNAPRDVEIEQDFGRGPRNLVLTCRSIHQDGGLGQILLAIEDITERKRAAEARFRRLFEAAQDGIIIASPESGEITDVNPFALSLFGYKREEMVGRKFHQVEAFKRSKEFKGALEEVTSKGIVRYDDLKLHVKDDGSVRVEIVANIYSEGEQRVVQFNIREIGARKDQEQRMWQTAKLESLGLLAGGIAHDFNNLLTGIMGNASLVLSDVPSGSSTRRMLEDVVRASERAAELTRQMLAYAGKGRFVVRRVDLSNTIRELTSLVKTSIPRKVAVKMDLRDDLPAVSADPSQMQQVMMNLIINAAEAIPEGKNGSMTLSTSVVEAGEVYLNANFPTEKLMAGTYVRIQVTDSGVGMDERTLAKIFDPFFTTKFTGRGLGLAAVQGIVRSHKGGIRVVTAPDKGTTFEVIFPAAPPLKPERPRVQPPPKNLDGTGTILVIDDEEAIRDLTRNALERHGYTVLSAEDGEAGIATFKSKAKKISLVILDMNMPVLGGPETLRRLRELRLDVPVILSSGYNESDALRPLEKKAISGFIQKPYTARQLAEKVKSLLPD